MRKCTHLILLLLILAGSQSSNAQNFLEKVKHKVKDKVNDRVDQKTDNAIDKGLDKTDAAAKSAGKKKESSVSEATESNQSVNNKASSKAEIKAYQNYDFVPGDKILFEDHFSDDMDAEFPSHWVLEKGQGQLNKIKGEEAIFLTEGNYAMVKPRIKTEKYLTDPFTIEYDCYNKDHAYGLLLFLKKSNPDEMAHLEIGEAEAIFVDDSKQTGKHYPDNYAEDNFVNQWHHIAIAVKNHQLKAYIDQNRVLVVPDTKSDFYSLAFGGIASEEHPLIFKDIRIASGGDMNMIGKKFTEGKIVTHGINFDVDKATIKPESMGTLNMIVQVLKDNPDVKFEIDGHTDNSGNSSHNLILSQQRAESVKAQLVSMGIESSRLTTKGLGDTKPMSENNTPEGKANNRRVEFIKI